MLVRYMWALGLASILGGCSAHSGLTGTYIGGDETGRIMVQITSIKDHEVTGDLTAVVSTSAGVVTAFRRHLSGAIDANLVNLNVENGSSLSLVTGTLEAKALSLTLFSGENSQKMLLERRDPNEFAALTEGVRRHAAAIKQAAIEQKSGAARIERISSDQAQINQFSQDVIAGADTTANGTAMIDQAAAYYAGASARAAKLGSAKARLVAQVEDSGQSDRNDFAKEQNADAARTRHESFVDALRSLNDHSRQRDERAEALMALCATSAELDCRGLTAAINVYRNRVAAQRTAIARENAAYQAVRAKL